MPNPVRSFFIITYFLLTQVSHGQSDLSIGQSLTLYSKTLEESRTYYLSLPESYFESDFSYPVLYVLDAESDFRLASATVEFLAATGKIPEMIVVGIVNKNRSKDLTPPAPNDLESLRFWGEIGGAEAFRQFIRNELIPHINQQYRTKDFRIIRGQSFGGLFGLHDLSQSNSIFDSYILSSPSARWNEGIFYTKFKQYDSKLEKVFIGEAEHDWSSDNGIRELSDLIAQQISKPQNFKYKLFENESHYSLVMNCTEDGLLFIFKNYPLKRDEDYGLAKMKEHYKDLSDELGYEIKIPMNEIIRLANSHLRNKEWSEGIQIAKENVRLYPNQHQPYWHVGDAYQLMGDKESAKTYFELALLKAKELGVLDLSMYQESVDQ